MLLLAIALLSILAPVLADTYLCPMAQAAQASRNAHAAALEEEPTCCSKASMPPPAPAGSVQWQGSCDCPQVVWDAAPAELLREAPRGVLVAPMVAVVEAIVFKPISSRHRFVPKPPSAVVPSGPPLWVRNQAILC
jgi:hypothetical protein